VSGDITAELGGSDLELKSVSGNVKLKAMASRRGCT